MNLSKFLQLEEEAKQDLSAARDLGNRMREARDRKQLAEADLQKAETAQRNHGHTVPARVRADAEKALAEHARLHVACAAADAAYQSSAQLVANMRAFLLTKGITV